MINFDSRGYITPYRNIAVTLQEFEAAFVSNTRRKALYELYLNYTDDLRKIIGNEFIQWIDGSYVTSKEAPEDVDLVTFIDVDICKKHEKLLNAFKYPLSKENYKTGGNRQIGKEGYIDAYTVETYPPDHRHYFDYQCNRAYWLEEFSKASANRQGIRHPKGFVEIKFN